MLDPPFTVAQFFAVFANYNAAIWPVQAVALGLCLLAVIALWMNWRASHRIIVAILALLWAVNGFGYHLIFFANINPTAPAFAVAFVLQATLFAAASILTTNLRFELRPTVRTAIGLATIVYALLIYPLLGYWAGHGLMAGPLVGVAPCPTTIFTIGLLLLARGKWVVWLSIIPILWSLVGLAAAAQLGVAEDFGLPVAAFALVVSLTVKALTSRPVDELVALSAPAARP